MTIHEDINKIIESATKNEADAKTLFADAEKAYKASGLSIKQRDIGGDHWIISNVAKGNLGKDGRRYDITVEYFTMGNRFQIMVYDTKIGEDVELYDDNVKNVTSNDLNRIKVWAKKYNK